MPIAINRTDFRVDLIPDRLPRPDADASTLLRQLLDLPPDEVERIRRRPRQRAAGYQPVQVAENLDSGRFAAVTVRLPELPGVAPLRGFSRIYPDGRGGRASGRLCRLRHRPKNIKATKNPLLITPGFKVGKDGLEKAMEHALRGEPGAKRIEVTAHGKLVARARRPAPTRRRRRCG